MILVWIERESLEGVDVKGRRAGTALCGARDSVAQLVLAGPGGLGVARPWGVEMLFARCFPVVSRDTVKGGAEWCGGLRLGCLL